MCQNGFYQWALPPGGVCFDDRIRVGRTGQSARWRRAARIRGLAGGRCDAGAACLLRVLPAEDGGDGSEAVGHGEAGRVARPALRLGDLRCRRLHPRADPCHGAAHPERNGARAGGASDLRRRHARRDRRCRAALLGIGHPPRRGAARRSAGGGRRLSAASRRLWLRRRSGGRPAAHRRFRDQRRGLSRDPSRGDECRSRPRQSQAQGRCRRLPGHHPVLFRRRHLSSLPRPRAGARHLRPDCAGNPAGDQLRPGQEIRRRLRRRIAGLDSDDVRGAGCRSRHAPPRRRLDRRRAMPAPAGARRRGFSFLHAQPGRLHRRDLPHDRSALAGSRVRRAIGGLTMAHILDVLREQVLLCDGAIGTAVHSCALDLARDFQNKENCTEVLNLSRPDVIRDIHLGHFRAGADLVQTNSFGASPITLAEFGLADQAAAINRRAAEIAREALGLCGGDGRDRFVIGSIGPGTRLPSLGHIAYQALEDALAVQSAGLVAGGVDAILIETCQDPLQIKAAVNGAKRARAESRQDIPIFVQVTVETTGTLLTGPDIAAAATVIEALDVPLLGLNCGTGPREMAEHLKWLSENWPGMISVQPNAGLPELIDGHTHYPLTADGMAPWIERFVREDGVFLVGGGCGTETGHIAALDAMLRRLAGDGRRPRPKDRRAVWQPSIASLYGQTPLRQENAYLSVGERCNANGSRQFRECQEKGDWDGAVAIAKDQLRHGSHAIDVCTAYVGRDEVAEMSAAITNFAGAVAAPLSIDSTELPVLEAALKLYGGKAIINSIHLEDGEESLKKRVALAKRFGAAVIALTIDEQGMAKAAPKKLALARRIHDLACGEMGLRPSDILFDPLTFTICTGNEDDRRLGVETLDGIGLIAEALPESQIILGLSNISF